MQIPTPIELGLPPALAGILRNPSGLILVTGPTGSGKSTSMASMIDVLNRNRACHIVTVEDPIEYLHINEMAAVSQREVGTDTESFDSALKSVLREDPDVVLVGEMRDLESISAALTIAETGHLVITTLHTNDSAQAIDRIIDVFATERRNQIQVQLAGTLLAVLYQRLIPKVNGGLVAAYELMVGVPAVRNLVREGKTRQLRNVVATHRADGMQTLENSLTEMVQEGLIDYDAATDASLYPQDIPKPQTSRGTDGGGGLMRPGSVASRSALPYQILAGVEPVRGGWLVAPGNLQGITLAPQPSYVLESLADVLDYRPSFTVVALHAPVGAPDEAGEWREADLAARDRLGRRRAAVVRAPSRAVLEAKSFEEARQIDPSLDIVQWRSLAKAAEAIREVQSWRQRIVWEVHPELALMEMNDGEPVEYGRRTQHGRKVRRELLITKLPGRRAGPGGPALRGPGGQAHRRPGRPVGGPPDHRPGHHPDGRGRQVERRRRPHGHRLLNSRLLISPGGAEERRRSTGVKGLVLCSGRVAEVRRSGRSGSKGSASSPPSSPAGRSGRCALPVWGPSRFTLGRSPAESRLSA